MIKICSYAKVDKNRFPKESVNGFFKIRDVSKIERKFWTNLVKS